MPFQGLSMGSSPVWSTWVKQMEILMSRAIKFQYTYICKTRAMGPVDIVDPHFLFHGDCGEEA